MLHINYCILVNNNIIKKEERNPLLLGTTHYPDWHHVLSHF